MSISLVANSAESGLQNQIGYALAYGGSGCVEGDLLVCTLQSNATIAATNPIVDTQGNVWILDVNYADGTGQFETVWHATAKTTGANTVTVTLATSNYLLMEVSEWNSTVVGNWVVDAPFVGSTDSTTPTQNSTAINTNYPVEVVIGTFHEFGTFSSVGSPFTLGASNSGAAGWAYYLPTSNQSGLQLPINSTGETVFTIGSYRVSTSSPKPVVLFIH
jgi:hypothetical protein